MFNRFRVVVTINRGRDTVRITRSMILIRCDTASNGSSSCLYAYTSFPCVQMINDQSKRKEKIIHIRAKR
jgi:hypothetical protein